MNKRDSIIKAALNLFVENGFHGTATSKIAQEAGVANGTLFQYFKTKEELIVTLYTSFKDELALYVANNTAVDANIKDTIKTNILASLYWALDNREKFRFLQQFHTSPYHGQLELEILRKYEEPHLQLIQQGINEGAIKQLPVDLLYALMLNQVFGLYQFMTSKELSKTEQSELVETTFEMLWGMIT